MAAGGWGMVIDWSAGRRVSVFGSGEGLEGSMGGSEGF